MVPVPQNRTYLRDRILHLGGIGHLDTDLVDPVAGAEAVALKASERRRNRHYHLVVLVAEPAAAFCSEHSDHAEADVVDAH